MHTGHMISDIMNAYFKGYHGGELLFGMDHLIGGFVQIHMLKTDIDP